jgi:hypothetical protein
MKCGKSFGRWRQVATLVQPSPAQPSPAPTADEVRHAAPGVLRDSTGRQSGRPKATGYSARDGSPVREGKRDRHQQHPARHG